MDALRIELEKHVDGTRPLQELSTYTNVWGIGAIMFELLTHEGAYHYLKDPRWTVNEAFTAIPNLRDPPYSGALAELIILCLMPKTWDRPSIEELEVKIEARRKTIRNRYGADPSLHQRERLYYKGSEINEMPPRDLNSWKPVKMYVPRPQDTQQSGDIYNPFTNQIVYPSFSHDGKEAKNAAVIPDDPPSSPHGSRFSNPVIIPDDAEEDVTNGGSKRRPRGQADEVNVGAKGNPANTKSRRKGRKKIKPRWEQTDDRPRLSRPDLGEKKLPGT